MVVSRVASSIGGAHTRVRPPPPVPLGTTSGPQDSRASCPPLRQRATGGRRHPERSDPMGVEAAQGEALQDVSTTRRDRARIESRGGDTAPTNNRRANGGLASFAQPGILRRSTPERHHQGHWPPLVSDGAHHRVRASAQRPPVTAPGSRDSSLRSQDARCGATIFTLRGRLWGGKACEGSAGVPYESHWWWCSKPGKIFTATRGCGTGLPGLEPDVSRRSSRSRELRSEGGLRRNHTGEGPHQRGSS